MVLPVSKSQCQQQTPSWPARYCMLKQAIADQPIQQDIWGMYMVGCFLKYGSRGKLGSVTPRNPPRIHCAFGSRLRMQKQGMAAMDNGAKGSTSTLVGTFHSPRRLWNPLPGFGCSTAIMRMIGYNQRFVTINVVRVYAVAGKLLRWVQTFAELLLQPNASAMRENCC